MPRSSSCSCERETCGSRSHRTRGTRVGEPIGGMVQRSRPRSRRSCAPSQRGKRTAQAGCVTSTSITGRASTCRRRTRGLLGLRHRARGLLWDPPSRLWLEAASGPAAGLLGILATLTSEERRFNVRPFSSFFPRNVQCLPPTTSSFQPLGVHRVVLSEDEGHEFLASAMQRSERLCSYTRPQGGKAARARGSSLVIARS